MVIFSIQYSEIKYKIFLLTYSSLTGQILSWLMKSWYMICIGFLATIFQMKEMREIVPFLKQLEFALVPLVQVLTSPPIKSFIATNRH